jgi:guanylate kinase
MGKAIIFSAPSGAGKTTIVRHLLGLGLGLEFSVSATSRERRITETDGKDYYFLTPEEFEKKISGDEFIEWEEVYQGTRYGTLKSEIHRVWDHGCHVIFDVDVVGGLNLKKHFGDQALAVFVLPPSVKVLRERLLRRGTESDESLAKRVDKAEKELMRAREFDVILVNDELEKALAEAERLVAEFLK